MSTEKQIIANKQNAQLATGPKTTSGKEIVSKNAIKHGIFTKDLIVSSEVENESENEYQDILNNLVDCLMPCNQMENLLVEKIAVDFWRLRRTIRFETGSITQAVDSLLKEYYSYSRPDNKKIDEEIQEKQNNMKWNTSYLECLANGEVSFDKPEWYGNDIESDIANDFYMIAKSIDNLTKEEKEWLCCSYDLTFKELHQLLQKYGYTESEKISAKLIELYNEEIRSIENNIQNLSNQKQANDESNKLLYMLGMIPAANNTEKVLKYERSLQKSIYQNLIMLKKLQEVL
jgi:hypothetical protein